MAFLDETGATILADEVKTYVGNTAVAKEAGKGLSTNDYTTTEKNKLAGIATGANKTIVDSKLNTSSTNPVQNKVIYTEFGKKLDKNGDSKDLTNTFVSQDSTNVTQWTDVDVLTSAEKHSSVFNKISTMFKNIRYLYKMLGTADISTLGEGTNIGTVTGALSKLNSDLQNSIIDGTEFGENWRGYRQVVKKGKLISVCLELNPQKIIHDDIIVRGLPVPFRELYMSLQTANGSYSCILNFDGTLKIYYPNYTNLERVDCVFTYICE